MYPRRDGIAIFCSIVRFSYLLTMAEYHPSLRQFIAENGLERVMFSDSVYVKITTGFWSFERRRSLFQHL